MLMFLMMTPLTGSEKQHVVLKTGNGAMPGLSNRKRRRVLNYDYSDGPGDRFVNLTGVVQN